MEKQAKEITQDLIGRIAECPTAYQTVQQIARALDGCGFTKLPEADEWNLTPGGKYYVCRNGSSVIAFELPESLEGFLITASHSDSPSFKLKENYEVVTPNRYLRLNVEKYGGMILSPWLDRPLSVAGRVTVQQGNRFECVPVRVKKPLCVIPNLAIHFNREINQGFAYNVAVDMLPLFGNAGAAGGLKQIIAAEAGVAPEQIVGSDLYLYDCTPGCIFGYDDVFYASPRLDDLACVYSSLRAFLESPANPAMAKVYACFDNEEVGSSTKQGAASPFLDSVLREICTGFGRRLEKILPSSMMVSADNGHAIHPNHPEKSDTDNAPLLNGGVVIKYNAAQKYTTDALSSALFKEVCRLAGVPYQLQANRSDLAGGSTLGNISNLQVPLCTVDIGLPQLAMHSCYETAGTADLLYAIKALQSFYRIRLQADENGLTLLSND